MKNERVMFTPTIDWMREAYDKFNAMFFKGKLPANVEFKLVNAKTFGGDAERTADGQLLPHRYRRMAVE